MKKRFLTGRKGRSEGREEKSMIETDKIAPKRKADQND
jgi:hypothetical protein